MKFSYLLVILCLFLSLSLLAQDDNLKIPLIGENPEAFGLKSKEYEKPLGGVIPGDLSKAYFAYHEMLKEIESTAKNMGHNIDGVKMWIKFFFDKDGTIDYVSYYLKPMSQPINTEVINGIFSKFIKQYKFSIKAEYKYSHYGSASFPVETKEKKTLDKTQD